MLTLWASKISLQIAARNTGDGLQKSTFRRSAHLTLILKEPHRIPTFVASQVHNRIVQISKAAGKSPEWGVMPSINYLWATLFRCLIFCVQNLNQMIRDERPTVDILYPMVSLFITEVSLMGQQRLTRNNGSCETNKRVADMIISRRQASQPGERTREGLLRWCGSKAVCPNSSA